MFGTIPRRSQPRSVFEGLGVHVLANATAAAAAAAAARCRAAARSAAAYSPPAVYHPATNPHRVRVRQPLRRFALLLRRRVNLRIVGPALPNNLSQNRPWRSGCGGDCLCTHVRATSNGLTNTVIFLIVMGVVGRSSSSTGTASILSITGNKVIIYQRHSLKSS